MNIYFYCCVVLCSLLPSVLLLIFYSIYIHNFSDLYSFLFSSQLFIVRFLFSSPISLFFFVSTSMVISLYRMLFDSLPFSNYECSPFLPFRFVWYFFYCFVWVSISIQAIVVIAIFLYKKKINVKKNEIMFIIHLNSKHTT